MSKADEPKVHRLDRKEFLPNKYYYRNTTDQEQFLPHVGVVGPGEIFESANEWGNPNFEQVKSKSELRRIEASQSDKEE